MRGTISETESSYGDSLDAILMHIRYDRPGPVFSSNKMFEALPSGDLSALVVQRSDIAASCISDCKTTAELPLRELHTSNVGIGYLCQNMVSRSC